MTGEDMASIHRRSRSVLDRLANIPGVQASLHDDLSYLGLGSSPMTGIPNTAIRIRHATYSTTAFARRLRRNDPPVFGRVADDHLHFNLRTVLEREIDELVAAVDRAVG